jgi:hypothetical protein
MASKFSTTFFSASQAFTSKEFSRRTSRSSNMERYRCLTIGTLTFAVHQFANHSIARSNTDMHCTIGLCPIWQIKRYFYGTCKSYQIMFQTNGTKSCHCCRGNTFRQCSTTSHACLVPFDIASTCLERCGILRQFLEPTCSSSGRATHQEHDGIGKEISIQNH